MKAYLEPDEVGLLEDNAVCWEKTGWGKAAWRLVSCLRDRLLIRLIFRIGCRIGEALALEVKDIDFEQGTVTIIHEKARLQLFCPECETKLGKAHRFCPGCGTAVGKVVEKALERQRMRTLPVDTETLAMLREYIDRGGLVEREGKLLLFGIGRRQAYQVVRAAAGRAGLGELVHTESGRPHHVSPHRLRDAFAVMAVLRDDSTDSIRMLQEHLGHASIATTMKYRKVAGRELREWYERLWKEG